MTNKDMLFKIPNRYFHFVYSEIIMKYIGLNSTETSIAISEWLNKPYDSEEYVWKEAVRLINFMEKLLYD